MSVVKEIWKANMVEIKSATPRPRGRPQIRPDEETRKIIISAAEAQFCALGFEATNINLVAQISGVSTKTLYRLFPTKADLFASVVTYRTTEFAQSQAVDELGSPDPRAQLVNLLTAYGSFVLSPVVVAITRLVIAEAERFPQVAGVFWREAVQRTNEALINWFEGEVRHGRLVLSDPYAAAGMLRGMMVMEPQREFFMGQKITLGPIDIRSRAEKCVDIFLHGAASRSAEN